MRHDGIGRGARGPPLAGNQRAMPFGGPGGPGARGPPMRGPPMPGPMGGPGGFSGRGGKLPGISAWAMREDTHDGFGHLLTV